MKYTPSPEEMNRALRDQSDDMDDTYSWDTDPRPPKKIENVVVLSSYEPHEIRKQLAAEHAFLALWPDVSELNEDEVNQLKEFKRAIIAPYGADIMDEVRLYYELGSCVFQRIPDTKAEWRYSRIANNSNEQDQYLEWSDPNQLDTLFKEIVTNLPTELPD